MKIAKLLTDHKYRSLHLPEVLGGDDSAGIKHELFIGAEPVGSDWAARNVVYFDETRPPSHDCCEADLTSKERSTHGDAGKSYGDFPHFWGINSGVLTARSFAILQNLLSPFVEFLPLHGVDETFFAFKVLRFVDALDEANSDIEWFHQLKRDVGKPRMARNIKKYVFHKELLDNEVLFRIPQMPTHNHVFATSRFIDAVFDTNLRGFKLLEVWPVPARSDEYAKYVAKHNRRTRRP